MPLEPMKATCRMSVTIRVRGTTWMSSVAVAVAVAVRRSEESVFSVFVASLSAM
ncbi:hypothetical protein [Streptomyces bikiniensis]|uniref:hypothetical protein n=1 Tax=Streptomyces bikiniensis TaxID=1896 RepID=UPI00131A4C58|nr:hypothetical protein [Streptomyces bikiniensis]